MHETFVIFFLLIDTRRLREQRPEASEKVKERCGWGGGVWGSVCVYGVPFQAEELPLIQE